MVDKKPNNQRSLRLLGTITPAKGTPIRVGSIIHLENGFENGGYLETRGSISDISVITKFPYPSGRSFVFTHENEDRLRGSGSWQIISVDQKKKPGTELKSGDEIYLLNMYPGAGYLDSFEWVPNLEPFKDYPMTIGVFTSSLPNRGGGISGTWIVELAGASQPVDKTIYEGATIHLRNKYPGAGYLHTWEEVTKHPKFEEYKGQRLFVFTSNSPKRARFTLVPGLADETMMSFLTHDNLFVVATSKGVVLESLNNIDDRRKATFNKVSGLAGSGVSFESLAQPEHYLRHESFILKLHPNNGSDLFRQDASFIEVKEVKPLGGGGNSDSEQTSTDPAPAHQVVSLQSVNFPNRYLVAKTDGSGIQLLPVSEKGSYKWTITLNNLSENLYQVQNQWGDESAPWHEGGIFKIGDRIGQPVVGLHIELKNGALYGTVTYKGEEPIHIRATHSDSNTYTVETTKEEDQAGSPKNWTKTGEWRLGVRASQNVTAMEIYNLNDDDRTLEGTMIYAGEKPIRIKAIRELTTKGDPGKLLYDYVHPDLLQRRTKKIAGVIEATYRLLADSCKEISGTSIGEATNHIDERVYGGDVNNDEQQPAPTNSEITRGNEAGQNENPDQNSDSSTPGNSQALFDDKDKDFQIAQLLNLHRLSQRLNSFFRDTLQALIKQSMQKHGLDKTLAPSHLYRACFQHIAADHEIIQQATIQRRWNQYLGDKGHEYYMSEQAVELMVMDKLAIKAIAPFQHLLTDTPDTLAIITYLSEKTHFHHLPYAKQVVLIGVSYDSIPPTSRLFDGEVFTGTNFSAFELMAIPHEMGHYVYQNGKLEDGKTFPEMSKQFESHAYYRWCEEIFADVYGCIVAGPLTALGMQALLTSMDRDRAWKDDEEHPTPVLRVFILAEILRILEGIQSQKTNPKERYEFSKVSDSLDKNWAKLMAKWGYERMDEGEGRPARMYMSENSSHYLEQIVNINKVLNAIRPIIDEFATRLLDTALFENAEQESDDVISTKKIPWTQKNSDNLENYNEEMAKMTNRAFAQKKVKRQILIKIEEDIEENQNKPDTPSPDKRIQEYLDIWGDSGPTGHGDH